MVYDSERQVLVLWPEVSWIENYTKNRALPGKGPRFLAPMAKMLGEREGRRLILGGDTAETPAFRAHRRHGPFDAAVMPIGAYNPWLSNHCTPEQAVQMADAAGARLFVPIHHLSFKLSREPVNEPLERVEAMLAKEHDRLALRAIGETAILS